jgi:hypothetical protein
MAIADGVVAVAQGACGTVEEDGSAGCGDVLPLNVQVI